MEINTNYSQNVDKVWISTKKRLKNTKKVFKTLKITLRNSYQGDLYVFFHFQVQKKEKYLKY